MEAARDGRPTVLIFAVGRASVPAAFALSCNFAEVSKLV